MPTSVNLLYCFKYRNSAAPLLRWNEQKMTILQLFYFIFVDLFMYSATRNLTMCSPGMQVAALSTEEACKDEEDLTNPDR